jgi:hypothetical protein
MRTWKQVMGAVVLVAALVAPATAAEPTLAEISAQIKKLSDEVAANGKAAGESFAAVKADMDRTNSAIATLRKDLDDLRRDLEAVRKDLKTEQVRGASHGTEVVDLKHRLDEVQKECRQQSDAMRRAGYFAPNGNGSDTAAVPPSPPPPPPPAVGTILLRNFSDVGGTFLINGQPYTVMPGQVMEVRNVPAGAFTYQIEADGYGALTGVATRALPAGGRFTLNINPRPQVVMLGP